MGCDEKERNWRLSASPSVGHGKENGERGKRKESNEAPTAKNIKSGPDRVDHRVRPPQRARARREPRGPRVARAPTISSGAKGWPRRTEEGEVQFRILREGGSAKTCA